MRIVSRTRPSLRKRLSRRLFSAPTLILAAAGAGLALCFLFAGIIVGAYFQETGNERYIRFLTDSSFAQNVVHKGLSWAKGIAAGENVPLNFAKGVAAAAEAEELSIDIAHMDYQRLAFAREQALDRGLLISSGDDYVPATITSGSESVRVKLRLKGDLADHYDTDKWSLRIVVKGDHTFWGMKVFSIQRPKTRNYLGEWFFLQALRREGLIAPRYRFIEVSINGERKGIYALEEHFEKRLVEHAERREGPVLRLNEDLLWDRHLKNYDEEEYGAFSSSPVEGYAEDTSHGSAFERGVAMLEAFRRGKLKTTEVFDGEKLATYLAMRDLCGANGAPWQNYRLYLDPVTSKLEPIAFDSEVDLDDPIDMLFCFDGGVMYKGPYYQRRERPDDPVKMFFADLDFFELYVRALRRLSEPSYLDELVADLGDELQQELHLVYRDDPDYEWSLKVFRENQDFMRDALTPPRVLNAYHQATVGSEVVLRLGNIQSLPVEVLGLARGEGAPVRPDERIVLRSKRRHVPVVYEEHALPIPPDWSPEESPEDLVVHGRLLGTDRTVVVPVYPWGHVVDEIVSKDWIAGTTDLSRIPWIAVDEETATIRILGGSHELREPLILPAGYTVAAGPGTRIDLSNGAMIVSYSPLDLIGSEDAPVVLESSDSTGLGLVVIEAGAPSTLDHALFHNLDAPRGNGWEVPAAVTFYESPVELENTVFSKNRCEDALNIMRTWFTLKRSTFVDNAADSFDGDFVEGEIVGCEFIRCGNDAIDFSGSRIEVEDTRMDTVGDKAVSAGEESELFARNVHILHAELAVTSKDLSTISFVGGTIRDSRVAFCAFQKKSEFGQGTITAQGVEVSGVEREYLIEPGSKVTIDGKLVELYQEGVKELLYGTEYGRSSN